MSRLSRLFCDDSDELSIEFSSLDELLLGLSYDVSVLTEPCDACETCDAWEGVFAAVFDADVASDEVFVL